MTRRLLPLALALLLGCGGSEGSTEESPDTAVHQDVQPDQDLLDQTSGLDVQDTQESDTTVASLPEPANPFPGLDNGTFVWTDGSNKITFTHKDGLFLVLEGSFSCVGDTGCKAKQDFTKLTCNLAYTKGYAGTLEGGKFTVTGIKGTDTLVGSVQAKDRIAMLYQERPEVSCCQKDFYFEATWKSKDDCADYATVDCDPYTDANCPEELNCIFGAYDKPVCIAAGDKAINEECATQGVCSDGYCMALEGMEKSRCLKYCKTDSDCGWNIQCLGLEGKSYKVCSLPASAFETCNLLEQNCTVAGEACYFSSSTVYQPICMKEGTGTQGDACTSSSECAKGYDCIAQKECMKLCDVTGAEPKCDSAFTHCPALVSSQSAGYCSE